MRTIDNKRTTRIMNQSYLPNALQQLFEQSLWQDTLYPPHKIHGMLFAIGCVPEIPLPETWLGYVFEQHAQVPQQSDLVLLTHELMNALAEVLADIQNTELGFSHAWQFQSQQSSIAKTAQTSPDYAVFLQGVLFVHAAQQAQWQAAWEYMPQAEQAIHSKTLSHCLSLFTTFADVTLSLSNKSEDQQAALVNALPQIFASLPGALTQYIELSGVLAGYLPDQLEWFNDGQNNNGQ